MTFRTRLLIAFAAVGVIPLALFGWRVRMEMKARLDEEGSRRVNALVTTIERAIAAERGQVQDRLRQLGTALASDNRFRLARIGVGESTWLLDWADDAMRASGLVALTLYDSTGQVLSSGHYRNSYGQFAPAVPDLLRRRGDSLSLARLRTVGGERLVLAVVDSLTLAGHQYLLVGGTALDSSTVASFGADPEVRAVLISGPPMPEHVAAQVPLVVVEEATRQAFTGTVAIVRDPEPTRALTRQVDRWFALVLGLTLMGAIIIAAIVARAMARPITDLANKAAGIDLDRLDVAFDTDRDDEIGGLSRFLAAMTTRLRLSAGRLRESERRAAVGDLARQVTHDIKNGLAPIRHTIRHLGQTVDQQPEQLADVYRARRGTVEASISYLDDLARNYAKLSEPSESGSVDLSRMLDDLARGAARDGIEVQTAVPTPGPVLRVDAVALRRILENLVANAVEATAPGGRVVLGAGPGTSPGTVAIDVVDFGAGMTRDGLERAFDDFFTTKPDGTGLGLSVVRRLVSDLGGSLAVETEAGKGTTFRVELPYA